MNKTETLFISPGEVIGIFEEKLNIKLWDQGKWRCPEDSIPIEWSDHTLQHEQDYAIFCCSCSDPFSEWDIEKGCSYFLSEEAALQRIKDNDYGELTFEHATCFLAFYGYIPKANEYVVTNGSITYPAFYEAFNKSIEDRE